MLGKGFVLCFDWLVARILDSSTPSSTPPHHHHDHHHDTTTTTTPTTTTTTTTTTMSHHLWSCHIPSCHVTSCHVLSCSVMSCLPLARASVVCLPSRSGRPCQVMSCRLMSCPLMSCHVLSCQSPVMLGHVMSRSATGCPVLSALVSVRLTYGSLSGPSQVLSCNVMSHQRRPTPL